MSKTPVKKKLSAAGFKKRGEVLDRLVRELGIEAVEKAMSDPRILGLVNFCCEGVANPSRFEV
jgi:hypothetical protein